MGKDIEKEIENLQRRYRKLMNDLLDNGADMSETEFNRTQNLAEKIEKKIKKLEKEHGL
jgi:hypothetical protein